MRKRFLLTPLYSDTATPQIHTFHSYWRLIETAAQPSVTASMQPATSGLIFVKHVKPIEGRKLEGNVQKTRIHEHDPEKQGSDRDLV